LAVIEVADCGLALLLHVLNRGKHTDFAQDQNGNTGGGLIETMACTVDFVAD
jgi:hypothetical protein